MAQDSPSLYDKVMQDRGSITSKVWNVLRIRTIRIRFPTVSFLCTIPVPRYKCHIIQIKTGENMANTKRAKKRTVDEVIAHDYLYWAMGQIVAMEELGRGGWKDTRDGEDK